MWKAVGLFLGVQAALSQQQIPGKNLINDKDTIGQMNSANGMTWTAGVNEYFEGMTFDEARTLLGTAAPDDGTADEPAYINISDADIPADFDSRTHWPGLIHPIRDQARCGSCWAFSASEVLSDRFAIATGKASPVLSAEDMVSCDKGDMGCSGGQLPHAWSYLKSTGIVTDSCYPYSAASGTAPACQTKCVDSESFTKFKAKSSYAIKSATDMQKEIMTNGPIQVAFTVYKSFMTYKSGVYQKHFWEILPEGGHAVKVVGWGSESGLMGSTPYWLVANSWNTNWGLDGLFKIKRGSNACGIESMGPPYAGLPDVSAAVVV